MHKGILSRCPQREIFQFKILQIETLKVQLTIISIAAERIFEI